MDSTRLGSKFKSFIADVVAPIVRGATGRASPLYFQREPTFRVIFPGEQAVGHPHRDACTATRPAN